MITLIFLFQGGLGALGGICADAVDHRRLLSLADQAATTKATQVAGDHCAVEVGDRVVTTGGIIGTITSVKDTSFLIRSADKSILEMARSAVAGIDEEPTN